MNRRSLLLTSALVGSCLAGLALAQTTFVQTVVGSLASTINIASITGRCVNSNVSTLGVGQAIPIPCDSSGNLKISASGSTSATNLTQVGGSAYAIGSAASAASAPVVIASDQAAVAVKQATASNLNATVVGAGSAGTANAGVVTVQGIASMTKLLVTPDALPANQSVNVAQVNGVTTLTGTGAVGTGAQRVAVGQDATTVAGMAPGAVGAGTAPADMVVGGCIYNATNPAATDTQSVAIQCDTAGRLKVNAQPATQNAVSGTANTTGNSTTSLVSAVTSNRIYVSAFSCANTGASASLISFQDGSGGTTLWTTIVPAGGGSNVDGNTALFKTTSGNGVYFLPATASTTIYCSAAGYSGP